MKELAEEFEKQFICLGKNIEKYMTFTVPIGKEVKRIDKNGEEITKNISYILQFIENARFMASSISNLVNGPSEGIHKIKCKFDNDQKCEICKVKYKYCDFFLEYTNFNEKIKGQFFSTYKFSNHDNNKFISLLQKGAYPYEHMDDWEKFNET